MSLRTLAARGFLLAALLPILGGAGLIQTTFDGWRRVTIPGTGPIPDELPDPSLIEGFALDPTLMDLTLGELLEDVEIREGDIREASIAKFTIEGDGDIGFFSAIEVWAIQGLSSTRLAAKYAFPPDTDTARLHVDEVDLARFVVDPTTRLVIRVNGLPPEVETKVIARYQLKFGLSGKGACYALKVAKEYENDTGLDTGAE